MPPTPSRRPFPIPGRRRRPLLTRLPPPELPSTSPVSNRLPSPTTCWRPSLNSPPETAQAAPPQWPRTPHCPSPPPPQVSPNHYAPRTRSRTLTSRTDIMAMNRLHTTSAAYADPTYTASASPVNGHFAATSAPPYDALGYAPAPSRQSTFAMSPETERRFSQQQ